MSFNTFGNDFGDFNNWNASFDKDFDDMKRKAGCVITSVIAYSILVFMAAIAALVVLGVHFL